MDDTVTILLLVFLVGVLCVAWFLYLRSGSKGVYVEGVGMVEVTNEEPSWSRQWVELADGRKVETSGLLRRLKREEGEEG
jgi:hypothetical protein